MFCRMAYLPVGLLPTGKFCLLLRGGMRLYRRVISIAQIPSSTYTSVRHERRVMTQLFLIILKGCLGLLRREVDCKSARDSRDHDSIYLRDPMHLI
jgi:hypothetical protein